MNETVKRIVEILFRDVEMTDEAAAVKDEVMNNCQERYADLVASGLSEDEAVAQVEESLKGMEEVIAEFPKVHKGAEVCVAEDGKRDLSFDAGLIELVDVQMIDEEVSFAASDDDMIHVQYDGETLPYVRAYVQYNTLHVEPDEDIARNQKRNRNSNLRVDINGDNVRVSRENRGVMETIFGAVNDLADSLKNMSIQIKLGEGDVTILLPAAWRNSIQCRTTSGNVEAQDVAAKRIQIETTNGDVTVDVHQKELQSACIKTTSGDVELSVYECRSCKVETMSGDVDLSGTYNGLEVNTISGDVELAGEFDTLNCKAVSGDMDITVHNDDLQTANLRTTSGDVELSMTGSCASANVTTRTVTGDVINSVPYRGEPSAKIHIETVSGDITVE